MKTKPLAANAADRLTGSPTQARRMGPLVGRDRYEIKIEGYLDECWSEWLGGLAITHDGQGCTLLVGIIPDQAALHGILAQIRDLGLTLISLTPKSSGTEEKAGMDE